MKIFYTPFLALCFIFQLGAQTSNTSPLPAGETVIGGHMHAGAGNEVWTDAGALYFNYRGAATATHFWNLSGSSGKSVMTLLNTGNVGIGTLNPFLGSNNKGLHIGSGAHSTIFLGEPSNHYGGIIQTSDNRHRIFLGANFYDDDALSWRGFDLNKGIAGINILADEGSWGTGLSFITSRSIEYKIRMHIDADGRIGIGSTEPGARLHLVQNAGGWADGIRLSQGVKNWDIVVDSNGDRLLICQGQSTTQGIAIVNGNVGIGKDIPGNYKLNVGGAIRANEIVVNTTGADFVFEPTYKLRTLKELETFIRANKHLPDIAPAKEMQQNGVSAGEMQAKLLQKVEELTLYVIEQEKKNEMLNLKVMELQGKIDKMESKTN